MKIILGITSSISAYKTPFLIREFQKRGIEVKTVATLNALHFVSLYALEALTGYKSYTDRDFFAYRGSLHIDLARWGDVFLVAPADYNTINKIASGVADNLITTISACFKGPIVLAPSMHNSMWNNPVLTENLKKLKKIGVHTSGPVYGELLSGDMGMGRFQDIEFIVEDTIASLRNNKLSGKSVLLVYGATEENIDSVRIITNRSSGKMGIALAHELKENGANLTQIVGHTHVIPYPRDTVVRVSSTADMEKALKKYIKQADILIMAAAVSDFKPAVRYKHKLKRRENGITVKLVPTQDLLLSIQQLKANKIYVGFSLESEEKLVNSSIDKMNKKALDIVVANTEDAMESDSSSGYIITKGKTPVKFESVSKKQLAKDIVKAIDKIAE